MTSDSNRFFVLTGGPGSGKTTLVEALGRRGFATTDEAGRAVIREEVEQRGDALPWLDCERFAERMFAWERESYRQAQRAVGAVFFDRGLPDTIGYLRLTGLEVPAWMEEETWRLRYNSRVFIAPPWPEIYGRDEERRQSWDIAVRTWQIMQEVYDAFGYTLTELPKASVDDRADFVMAATAA